MCRFALYLGQPTHIAELVTAPDNSIINQSFHSHLRKEPLNGDGFGVAWYAEGHAQPAVFKEVHPAWNSLNLRSVARVTRSTCILAHVRAASPGLPVSQVNCHPFARGPLAFMHNGGLAGFKHLMRRLRTELSDAAYEAIEGTTDSEHLLALAQDAWDRRAGEPTLARLGDALTDAIATAERLRAELAIAEPSLLNLVLTDGAQAAVTRWISDPAQPANTLFVHQGAGYHCQDGVCRMIATPGGRGCVIVASEPLSEDPGWQEVPVNHRVLVDADLDVEIAPIALPPAA